MMNNVVKIYFKGFWNNFDYKTFLPYQLMSKRYNVQISDNPDILFCSIFDGFSFCKYDCIRVFCTSECYYPDMNLFDYALSITKIDVGDRVMHLPYFMYIPNIKELEHRETVDLSYIAEKTKFCNFIYSHPAPKRDHIFNIMSTYKRVDSAGRHLNNMGGYTPGERNKVTGIDNDPKLAFQSQYKFTIACENYLYDYYVTEKIVHAYMARTIPVYYGDSKVCEIFNPKSFVNVSDFSTDEELLKIIEEIDNDDNLFISMLNEPVLNTSSYILEKIRELDLFLQTIVERKDEIRRPQNYNTTNLNNWLLSAEEEKRDSVLRTYRFLKRKLR